TFGFDLAGRDRGGGDGLVVFTGVDYRGNAGRQLQRGQVDRVTDFQLGQIDFDRFRQVFRQARDFQIDRDVVDDAARQLDGWRDVRIHEMQCDLDGNLLVGIDALEIG